MNKAILIGRLGRDPEVRRMQSGKPVVNLRIATSERWRDKESGERKEHTDWHDVVIFNEGLCKVAEQYLSKGSQVMIEGKIQTRKWEKDGVDRYTTEIVIQSFGGAIELLGGKSENGDSERGERQEKSGNRYSMKDDKKPKRQEIAEDDFGDEEIPF